MAVVWAVMIGVLSLMPQKSLTRVRPFHFEGSDKLGHFAVYAVLCGLLCLLKARYNPSKPANDAILAILISGLYGVTIEVLQHLSGVGRHFELIDIIANIGGSVMGAATFLIVFKQRYYGS